MTGRIWFGIEMNDWQNIISGITRIESRLIYYSPIEVAKALKEDRVVLIREAGKLAAFGIFDIYGDWIELHTIYVMPEFRGRGYSHEVISGLKQLDKYHHLGTKKIFMFSRAPQIIRIAQEYGFKSVSFWHLPMRLILKILIHRFAVHRLPTHLKHGWKIFQAATSQLFVLD